MELVPFDQHAQPREVYGEILSPTDTVQVIAFVSPFTAERTIVDLPAGLTVEELLDQATPVGRRTLRRFGHVTLGEDVIPRELWNRVRPKPGTTLIVRSVVPQGGGNGIMRALLILAIAAAAAWAGPALAAAAGLTGVLGTVVGGLIGAAIAFIGNLLVNALFPVKTPKIDQSGSKSLENLTGTQNQSSPWNPVPVVLGKMRLFPVYGSQPYTEIVGDDQYLRCLFVWGYGPLSIDESTFKIGETLLTEFQGVETETVQGYADDPSLTLFPSEILQSNIDVLLAAGAGTASDNGPGEWQTQTSADSIIELSVDFSCPAGLYKTDSGKKKPHDLYFEIEYRATGTSGWTRFVDNSNGDYDAGTQQYHQHREQVESFRLSYRISVPSGQYDVRCRKSHGTEEKISVAEQLHWIAIRGMRAGQPINADKPLAMTVLRIKASDQLNGVVDTFSGICTSILPDWTGSTWTERATQNPAAIFRSILQGPANARPLSDDRIDLASLQAWSEQCVTEGWKFNQVRANNTSVYDALTDVATAGRAAVSVINGKWGVITDDPDAPIVQHFTPRNSWGFQSERSYADLPQGLRIKFTNERLGYQQDERHVYIDGYDSTNATKFEGVEFAGVTDPDLVWRHGRFHLAQALLRPEKYSLQVDFENLVCTRGDLVRVTHDVPKWGLGFGRVKSISGSTVTLDDFVTMDADSDYCIRFRAADGTSILRDVVNSPGDHFTITLSGSDALPAAGDLFQFGTVGSESVELIVFGIAPGDGLTATLTLVDAAPAIRDADSGDIPPFDSQISEPVDERGRIPPSNLAFNEGLFRVAATVEAQVSLSWQRPPVIGPVSYEVQYRISDLTWRAAGTTTQTAIKLINLDGGTYDFRVRTLGPNGTASDWVSLTGQVIQGLLAPPGDVSDFRINTVGANSTLTWNRVSDLDLAYYEIRFTPDLSDQSWQNSIVLATNLTSTSIQLPTQVGTYLIKAFDTSGVESVNADLIVTNIAAIDGLNFVDTADEAAGSPIFAGTLDNVIVDHDLMGIRIDDVDEDLPDSGELVGTYYFANDVDLGDVFTSRVTASVTVRGIDTAQNFLDFENVLAVTDILGASVSAYQVDIYYRSTSGDPGSSPVAWSEWTPFLVTDVTARAYQFKAILRSYQRGVTPVILELSATVDMPDRLEANNDVSVGTGGATISYSAPFMIVPAVAVSIQNAVSGDYYTITSPTESGFTIRFYNSSNSAVARTFDWHAKGYGRLAA